MCESNVPPDDGFKMTTRQQEFLSVEISRGKFSLEVKLLKLLSVFKSSSTCFSGLIVIEGDQQIKKLFSGFFYGRSVESVR